MSNVLLRCGIRSTRSNARFFSAISQAGPSLSKTTNTFRIIRNVSLATTFSLAAYTLGALYPPPIVTLISPRAAPGPPLDPNSPAAHAYTARIEAQLQTLPLLQTHRSRSDADEWYETRPYFNFPEERRVNSLTAGALRGPGKLATAPLIRSRRDESETIAVVHVGRGLCGHDGIIHGGLLATLLDETLARAAINNLPEKVGVTANLSMNYRAPTKADQFIVIKTKLIQLEGRKVWVEGYVEDTNGLLLTEAKAMFVQPKYAKLLNTAAIRQAMGEPDPAKDIPVHLADGQVGISSVPETRK